MTEKVKIAVLDDYQGVALKLADWSVLDGRAAVTVFNDHLADTDAVVERLKGFDVLCVMRERTPLNRALIERLPNLQLIASTGRRNASIDEAGSSISCNSAAHNSPALCGGMLVAMPTAMPDEPLARRFGNAPGSTTGSRLASS